MVESNFKEINLRKLNEKSLLIKYILTLDSSNTHQSNGIETIIRTFDLSKSFSSSNSLTISDNNCFEYHNDHLVSYRV